MNIKAKKKNIRVKTITIKLTEQDKRNFKNICINEFNRKPGTFLREYVESLVRQGRTETTINDMSHCKQLFQDEVIQEKISGWENFIAIYMGRGMYNVYPVMVNEFAKKDIVLKSGNFKIKKIK